MFTATGLQQSDTAKGARKLVRKAGKQILVLGAEGRVFAIANRCPHEGYPLSEGTQGPGCVLTCNWHNWKFDLTDGAALIGRDPVRTYPVEIRGGEIFLDLTDPPAETQKMRALNGLSAAIADVDAPRIAREAARLERAGFDASLAFAHAIIVRNERLEDGMTHAYGAGADWLALAARAPDAQTRLAALLEPVSHIAWDSQGADLFAYAQNVAPWDARAFIDAVEAEREADAIAMMRGAIETNISYDELRPVLAEAALAHYADFGHCAIYTFKTGQLLARLDESVKEPLLLALTRRIVRATREERIPEFRSYSGAVAAWDDSGESPACAADFIGLSVDAILQRVLASSARPVREIYDALLGAAAFNLLHFDITIDAATDNAIADNIGWLDFTHALTFANACRHICEDRPDLWPRALLQMALFVGRNRKYVSKANDSSAWTVADRDAFIADNMTSLYDHGIVEPIVACHRLKVLFALEDELRATPDTPWAGDMCAAINRYLHTPMKRHHGLRNAAQAMDFIAKEG
jgi:nitrite reductase/ring-hydroxylating ferredoxin subunit